MSSPSSETLTLSRDELYQQVWSTPMRHLALRFGLSDVGLAKICKSHDIPRPPRGYWAKKEFGQEPPQVPLPPRADPRLQTIRLTRVEPGSAGRRTSIEPEFDPDIVDALQRARALPPVAVGNSLRGLHPLVQVTRDALEQPDFDHSRTRRARPLEKCRLLSVSVSKA